MPRLTANSFDDPAWAIVVKGWDEYANNKFDEAIASFTTALNSFDARTPMAATMETRICRGAAFARSGKEHAAIDDFTKAIALDPQRHLAFYNRGISRQTLGLYDLAIDDFSRVIELRPTYTSGYIRRGVCLKRLNDKQRARRDFAEARRLIVTEKQADRPKAGQRPKTLADVEMRFPPPPGTRFYACFTIGDLYSDCQKWPTVVADSLDEAIEQLLCDYEGTIDPRLKYAPIVWIDHNGNARCRNFWLDQDDKAGSA